MLEVQDLPWLFSLLGGGVEDAGQFQAASGAQGGCFDVEQFQLLTGGRPMAVADGEWDEDGVGLAVGMGGNLRVGMQKAPAGRGFGEAKKPRFRGQVDYLRKSGFSGHSTAKGSPTS